MDTKKSARRVTRPFTDMNTALPQDLNNLLIQAIEMAPMVGPHGEYLRKEVLSKYLDEDGAYPAPIRRERAIAKWRACEDINRFTNDMLFSPPEIEISGVSTSKFISYVAETIEDCIGATVPIDALIGGFSGGASTSRSRTESHPALKYTGQADITAAALSWFNLAMCECPGWDRSDLHLNIVEGNVMFTVPKKTDIDRVACKEPDINMWLQKGVGNYFRNRLKRKGINLNDQSRNRKFAHQGSVSREIATLDLSSASDSVTMGLCELVLPYLWFDLLSDLRSPYTIIDGDKHENEMMSSMGNGFTFELESLIFWAITKTCSYLYGIKGPVSVYGDDIICPTDSAPLVMKWLEYFGFTVNTEKSFYTKESEFRESCGGHYHDGKDISPFYLRKPVKRVTDLINILNKMRKWAVQVDPSSEWGVITSFQDIWIFFSEFVPENLKGGFDYELNTQLVSRGGPSKRLVPFNPKRVLGDKACYTHWLNTTWDRKSADDGVQTSVLPKVSQQTFRLRNASRDACGLTYNLPSYLGET